MIKTKKTINRDIFQINVKYLRTGRISLHINTISLQRPAPYSSQDLYVRLSTAFCCITLEVHVGQSQPKLYFTDQLRFESSGIGMTP